MLTMHPTLLIGPADWDPERMPKAEFDGRIARLWQTFPDAAGAIVYGGPREHAALAYLTNFTPKLEPGIALIPRSGEPRLMVGGGANMLPAAKPLTWVSDLVPLQPVGKTVAQWLSSTGAACVCIGCDSMPTQMHRQLEAALSGTLAIDGTAAAQSFMQSKSPRELACVREACAALEAAAGAMTAAYRAGEGVTGVVLAGERAAIRLGAQDVRTLFSLDGGRTMRPFETPIEHTVDPLPVYVAVRKYGYWADATVHIEKAPDPAANAARSELDCFLTTAKRGVNVAPPIRANGIGLSADEGLATTLHPGGVYRLQVSAGTAIASAIVAVTEAGIERLSPAQ
jgi:hypothetical protein